MARWIEIVPTQPDDSAGRAGLPWLVLSRGKPPMEVDPWLIKMIGRYDYEIYIDGVAFKNFEDAQLFYLTWAGS